MVTISQHEEQEALKQFVMSLGDDHAHLVEATQKGLLLLAEEIEKLHQRVAVLEHQHDISAPGESHAAD